MHNLFRSVQLVNRTSYTSVGSTANVTCAGFDATPFGGVSWVVLANGNLTTSFAVKAQECSSSGFTTGSDVADLTGTQIDGTTSIADGVMLLDLFRPTKQWVRAVLVKGNTGDLIDGVLALGYLPRQVPVTHSTSRLIGAEYNVQPATGTA